MSEFVQYRQEGRVAVLTLNDPEMRNALSTQEQYDAIADTCARVQEDASVSCVVLTGAGTAFCSGGNLKDMKYKSGISGGSPYDIRDNYRRGIQKISLALYNLDLPTIAAVNGPAIGAGCDLACMCDIRIASERARMAESFVKLGITPGDGGAWLLPRVVGMSKAAEMTFTGDILDAQQALACGLVSRVVAHDALLPEALALAGRIAANPRPALRMAKRLLREGQHQRLESALDLAGSYQAIAHFTPEHAAAVEAFLASRKH